MSDVTRVPGEPEKVFAIDAEYLSGKRFEYQEDMSLVEDVDLMAATPGEEITAFLVCDHRTLRKYGLGCVPPFPMPIGQYLRTGYLKRGGLLP